MIPDENSFENNQLLEISKHFISIKNKNIRQIIDSRSGSEDWIIDSGRLLVDIRRNLIESSTMNLLGNLLESRNFSTSREKLFSGQVVNITENKSADHIAPRNSSGNFFKGNPSVSTDIGNSLQKIKILTESIHSKTKSDTLSGDIAYVVHIGIGGSDLGPRLCVDALDEFKSKTSPEIFFLASVDPYQYKRIMSKLQLEKTLFIVVSKSFKTPETKILTDRIIADLSQKGIDYKNRFIAISANTSAPEILNIHPENFLSFPDTIGGRYSLWSAVGLIISLFLGYEGFTRLLKGAAEMDEHFFIRPSLQNIPVITALLDFWYIHFFRSEFFSVNPYTERLKLLPDYLQQLVMESNGKSCNISGEPIRHPTAVPVIGGTGTGSQHSYFQALHQGTHFFHMDFIGILQAPDQIMHTGMYDFLFSNLVAQSHTMTYGHTSTSREPLPPFREINGKRPCTHIFLKKWNPETLGQLLAMYEHKTFVSGILWQIDSFDQWGVERGKIVCSEVQKIISGKDNTFPDDSIAEKHILLYKDKEEK
ncbi:MAG: hypothetical protein OEV66_05260 [Spirochaetia bacterium]|nr:hypothetical protein [Spirochaetia bacterium]